MLLVAEFVFEGGSSRSFLCGNEVCSVRGRERDLICL